MLYKNIKKKIRISFKKKLLKIKKKKLNIYSNKIIKNIIQITKKNKINNIALYYPKKYEINLIPLIKKKKIYIPIIKNKLIFTTYNSKTKLYKNKKFNIYEPKLNKKKIIKKKNIDLILVPLLAFDKYGNRIGRGGGYYDKFLKNYNKKIIGVGLDIQLYKKKLPTNPHDIKLPIIITPKKIWKIF